MITEFGIKLPTSSGLCLSGGGFFNNYSMLSKYNKSTSNGSHTGLTMFFSTSEIQHNWRHWKRLGVAPRNGPQASAPQQLPCIKMALAWLCFSITIIWLSFMASNRPGLYRSEVGYPSPTSSQNLGSKKCPISPKNGENQLKIGI